MEARRTEHDSMGSMEIPADAYYGAQTARAVDNFPISNLRFPREFIRALAQVKRAAALVNRDLGLFPAGAAPIPSAIVEAADRVIRGELDDQFVVDVFQTGSGTSTNMNANEVIAGAANERLTGRRGGRSPVHPNDHVNKGQSSNDVIPTALHIAALEGIERDLVPALRVLHGALERKAREFDRVVKIGRTHLQDATPIRLGQEFSGYAGMIAHAIDRVGDAGRGLAELAIGGTAVGTGINTHPEFARRMVAQISRDTGLEFRSAATFFEALGARDAAVQASGALKTTAVSLYKIANDIRWLSSGPRCGIGEISLPALQPGSSIMPGKVNPVIPECVMMVAAQVIGNDAAITTGGLSGNLELNVMIPVIAHNLLESIRLLAQVSRIFAGRCIAGPPKPAEPDAPVGIQANVPRCAELIERSLAMCTALAPRIGYDAAAAIAKRAFEEGTTVGAIARRDAGIPPEELDRLLDPWSQTEPGGTVAGGGG